MKTFFQKNHFFSKKGLTNQKKCIIIDNVLREWRNWQTRTFEGRVIPSYGFDSRLPHQQKGSTLCRVLFVRVGAGEHARATHVLISCTISAKALCLRLHQRANWVRIFRKATRSLLIRGVREDIRHRRNSRKLGFGRGTVAIDYIENYEGGHYLLQRRNRSLFRVLRNNKTYCKRD